MGVSLMLDQRVLADPDIALAQINARLLGLPDQTLPRPVDQLGIGWKGDVLLRHRGIDNSLGKVPGLGRAHLYRHRQAFLEQGLQPLLALALAPAGHRRTIKRQCVAEKFLAAKILVIGVLHPARAKLFVR